MSESIGMAQHEVTRTLVKSQPEVWTQCSDANSLGRHLSGSFGEIRITRLDPEHSVAWEGEEVSGTVTIEPSAWGTRVTLSVEMASEIADLEEAAPPPPAPEPERGVVVHPEAESESAVEPEATLVPEPESPPVPPVEHEPAPRRWARFRAWWQRTASLEPPPDDELPVDDDAVVGDDLPSADETAAVEEPVAEEPELPVQREPEPTTEEPATREPDPATLLTAALESLGQAHHRPFSRA